MKLLDLFVYSSDSMKIILRNGEDICEDILFVGDFIEFPQEYKDWFVDYINVANNHMIINIYN